MSKDKIQFGWIKYRTTSSSGYGTWKFKEIEIPFTKEHRNALREKIDAENEYSEHYRGCDIVKISSPPKDYLLIMASYNKSSAKRKIEAAGRYEELAKKLPDKRTFYVTLDGSWVCDPLEKNLIPD